MAKKGKIKTSVLYRVPSHIILYFDATFSMLNTSSAKNYMKQRKLMVGKGTLIGNISPFSVRHSRIAKRAIFLFNISSQIYLKM